MRHGIAGNRLGRNRSLRKATIRDLAKATLIRERICTTKPKAQEARKLVERLITLGKKNTLAAKRRAFAILCDHSVVSNLFGTIAPRFNNRLGGYTRIISLSNRHGDNAQMAFLELTEKSGVIISQPRTEAMMLGRTEAPAEAEAAAVPSKGKGEKSVEKPAEKSPAKPAAPDPKKAEHTAGPDKSKKAPKIMGGIKKIFKKPSTGGA